MMIKFKNGLLQWKYKAESVRVAEKLRVHCERIKKGALKNTGSWMDVSKDDNVGW